LCVIHHHQKATEEVVTKKSIRHLKNGALQMTKVRWEITPKAQ
jgi:hypothetical protein